MAEEVVMKKEKMSLVELRIKSFVTDQQKAVKGGTLCIFTEEACSDHPVPTCTGHCLCV